VKIIRNESKIKNYEETYLKCNRVVQLVPIKKLITFLDRYKKVFFFFFQDDIIKQFFCQKYNKAII